MRRRTLLQLIGLGPLLSQPPCPTRAEMIAAVARIKEAVHLSAEQGPPAGFRIRSYFDEHRSFRVVTVDRSGVRAWDVELDLRSRPYTYGCQEASSDHLA